MKYPPDLRGNAILWAILTLLLVAALGFGIYYKLQSIPHDVQIRIDKALEQAGFKNISLSIDGRDVTLDGDVDARLDRTEILRVARSTGVARTIRDRLNPVQPPSAQVEVRFVDERVNVAGAVMTQSDADLLASAVFDRFPDHAVNNRLEISPSVAEAPWLEDLARLVALTDPVDHIRIAASDDVIILEGVVDSADLLGEINRQAQALFLNRTPLENRLGIERPLSSPELVMERNATTVRLTGQLASEDQRRLILNAVTALISGMEIVDDLVVTDAVSSAAWIETAELLVPELRALRDGSISLDNSQIVISGLVSNESQLAAINTRVTTVTDKLPLVNELVVVQPDRPAYFNAIVDKGRVTLTGLLSNQADANAIVDAVRLTYGPDLVNAELGVDDMVIDPAWRRGMPGLLEVLASVSTASVSADQNGVRLSGVVSDPQTGDRLMREAGNIFPPGIVTGSFNLKPPTQAPEISILADDNAVALSGLVGDPAQADAWKNAVALAFPGREINAKIGVSHEVLDAYWLSQAETVAAHLAMLENGGVIIGSGQATFSGTAHAPELIEATRALAGSFPGMVVDNLVAFDAPATEDPGIEIVVAGNAVSATGKLAVGESHNLVDQGLRNNFGDRLIANRIESQDVVKKAPWIQAAVATMPALEKLTSGKFSISGKQIDLTGTAANESIRNEVLDRLNREFDEGHTVNAMIQVMLPATITLRLDSAAVTVNGSLPDDGSLDMLVSNIRTSLPGRTVTSNVLSAKEIHPATWLEVLGHLLPELALVSDGVLEVSGQGLTLTGVVPTRQDAVRAKQALAALVADRLEVTSRFEVLQSDADALAQALGRLHLKAIQFDTGSDSLTAEGQVILDQAVPVLGMFPEIMVEIAGHTDSRGSEASNQRLSERRAARVRDYLVGNGVSSAQIVTAGYGELKPVADNDSEPGRAANRRIEFNVKP